MVSTAPPRTTATMALSRASAGWTSGWLSAAASAMAPNAAKIAQPSQSRRPARTPAVAAMATAAITIRPLRAALSFVPKRSTKTSLAPGGWRLMTSDPTATTSDGAPAAMPAKQLRAGDRDAAGHGAGQGQRSGPADLDAPAGDWAGGIDPTDLRGSGACHAAEPRGDV